MLLGVDYYPEQWSPALTQADMDRIVELGCNVIRIGEFAWHRMEPEEGHYDFSYFDSVIAMAKAKGLQVIFGTPTATPPAWLIRKHPEILSRFENGSPRAFGGRHVACYSSTAYLRHCADIIRELSRHYRDESAIVAWQIDNELGHEGSDQCWCPQCHAAFQEFLRRKFGSDIHALNEAYGTAFWSQEYNDFDEIPLPLPTITTHNPALRMDWERFCSEKIRAFTALQAQLLRENIPGAVVMHDFPGGGLTKHVDYSAVAGELDRVAYNNYPVWGGQKEPLPPSEIAFGLDYIRGLKGENFWITEAIMGAQGHDITGFLPRPNQAKLWSWQGMAHGCEGLMYFRYRGATKGAEQFCYGILDADNIPRRRFLEVQSFFREVRPYRQALTTPVHSDVAMLYDYDALASFRIQQQSILLNCETEMKRLHGVLFRAGQSMDIIPASRDFSGYSLVLVPNMIVTDPEFAARLKAYVAAGGVAVVTYRTGVKNRDNNLVFGKTIPVDLGDLLGLYVEETESVQEYSCIPLSGENSTGTAGIFRDMVVSQSAQVLLRYDDPFYRQYAAITRNTYGQGIVYYLGTTPDPVTLDQVLTQAMARAGLERLELPEGVESVVRGEGDNRVRILLNHNDVSVHVLGQELSPFQVKVIPLKA